jgi:hypothetical protein
MAGRPQHSQQNGWTQYFAQRNLIRTTRVNGMICAYRLQLGEALADLVRWSAELLAKGGFVHPRSRPPSLRAPLSPSPPLLTVPLPRPSVDAPVALGPVPARAPTPRPTSACAVARGACACVCFVAASAARSRAVCLFACSCLDAIRRQVRPLERSAAPVGDDRRSSRAQRGPPAAARPPRA